jgi:hypothetical protein
LNYVTNPSWTVNIETAFNNNKWMKLEASNFEFKMREIARLVIFEKDLNLLRNNEIYTWLTKYCNLWQKIEKISSWLSKLRKRKLIIMAEYLWSHKFNQLLYQQKNQQPDQVLLKRNLSQYQDNRYEISYIHKIVPKIQ